MLSFSKSVGQAFPIAAEEFLEEREGKRMSKAYSHILLLLSYWPKSHDLTQI